VDFERGIWHAQSGTPDENRPGWGPLSSPDNRGASMELFKELIELSYKEKRGLTIFIKGQTIAGIVTQIIGLEAIEVRNQTFSKVIIRLDAVDAMAIS
jgi:hypothetical protein